MIVSWLFIGLGIVACVLAVLAFFGITHVALAGSQAIANDGLARGAQAPHWSLADAGGQLRISPPTDGLQLVVFGDHSLKSFPSAVDGLRALSIAPDSAEVVIMARRASSLLEPLLPLLGLCDVPLVIGSPSLYGHYNVRVMPFAVFVDSDSRVRSSGLINTVQHLDLLWRLAQVPLNSGDTRSSGARPRSLQVG